MADQGHLLDIPAAAERLGVTQRWVRRAVAERRITFVNVGRNVQFEPEAISRYIERGASQLATTPAWILWAGRTRLRRAIYMP